MLALPAVRGASWLVVVGGGGSGGGGDGISNLKSQMPIQPSSPQRLCAAGGALFRQPEKEARKLYRRKIAS